MGTSLTGATWVLSRVNLDNLANLQHRVDLSAIAARCLAIRLQETGSDGTNWLSPSIEHFHDPHLMHGMQPAVERIRQAVKHAERVRVVTDYDVDGTTSSLILQAAMRFTAGTGEGAQIDYHIPDRFVEGYGFSVSAAEAAVRDNIQLIVTADIGVRDHGAVAHAVSAGVDVLICDHHLPAGTTVPDDAIVLCPPQSRCNYPNPHLAACGISLKLADALLGGHARRDVLLASMLKLAAIGTVADLVPLTTSENRAIVALGLRELNNGRHTPGLSALIEVAGLSDQRIRESDLGFRIGPRINAAGRVSDARLVVELLTCKDSGRARTLALQLDRQNSQRKDLQRRLVDEVLKQIEGGTDPFVVVAGPEEEGWHRGVIGIVASRVRETIHRPVAVVSIQGERAVGSVRSIPGIHAVKALDAVHDLLEKYGGHPVAAGFTVPTSDLDALKQRLCDYVVRQADLDMSTHALDVDAEVEPVELTDRLHRELESLGPFGQGNQRPRLMLRGVDVREVSVRSDGSLLCFRIPRPGTNGLEAVWWDHGQKADLFSSRPVDLLGELTEHWWKGSRRLQFHTIDARLTEPT